MAITGVPEYAHLSDADVEALATALEQIRQNVEVSRGAKDRDYLMRAIRFQRFLEIELTPPDRFLVARSHDAPETASEDRFRNAVEHCHTSGDDVPRRGLATAIRTHRGRRLSGADRAA